MKLELCKGSFWYHPETPVLQDVSFVLEQGQIMSILGSNGVGKTTLLKCLLGLQRWKRGSVYIDGQERESLGSAAFWQKVAYVPQARSQSFSYTVEETVLMGRGPYLRLFEMPGKQDREIAEEAMEMAGVTRIAGKNCGEISGGELQLVLIARALASRPELLVMDEPETGLDFHNQLMVLDLIERLRNEYGRTVILNTHYPEHALQVSDRALVLLRGGESLFGTAREVITEDTLSRAFDVDVRIRSVVLDAGRDGEYACVLPVRLRTQAAVG
ncbi:MAG: ABC transporter ATP-binding protein [Lachnospiraceae bacterium]